MNIKFYHFLTAAVVLVHSSCQKKTVNDQDHTAKSSANVFSATGKTMFDNVSSMSSSGQVLFTNTSLKQLQVTGNDKEEIAQKIAEIVKPVIEQLGKLMESDPDNYKAYQNGIRAIAAAKTMEEKKERTAYVSNRYYSFVKKMWEAAKIDEPYYQSKIKEVFPGNIKDRIKFSEFLRFEYELSKPVEPYTPPSGGSGGSGNTGDNTKPEPPNPFLCFDALPSSFSSFNTSRSGVGSGWHKFIRYNPLPGRTHNVIETKTDTQSPYGSCLEAGIALDSFSIPGKFPLDSRHLQVSTGYGWDGSAYVTSILGCSIAYYYKTSTFSGAVADWDTEICICAPATFVLWSMKSENVSFVSKEFEKMQGKAIAFGFGTANLTGASGIAFAGAHTLLEADKWNICEIP